jgi:hypothetical protein
MDRIYSTHSRMINERKWKVFGRRSCSLTEVPSQHFPEVNDEDHKKLQAAWCLCQNSNQTPSECDKYKSSFMNTPNTMRKLYSTSS